MIAVICKTQQWSKEKEKREIKFYHLTQVHFVPEQTFVDYDVWRI